ncbi:monocarboxylate transporter 12-like [Glandiceps talaboti]
MSRSAKSTDVVDKEDHVKNEDVENYGKYLYEDDPPDGGWGWVVVISAHFILLLSLGSLTSFGPFIVRLNQHFDNGTKAIGLISGIALLVTLSTGPVASALNTRYCCRSVTVVGGIVATTGVMLSSLAKEVYHLYLTYSVIGGIGYGLVLTPSMTFTARYFKKRYALANGIGFSGVAVAWIALPPLFQVLINALDWRYAFVVVGALTSLISVCGAFFKPPPQKKVPIEPNETHTTQDIEQMDVENGSSKPSNFKTSTSKTQEKSTVKDNCCSTLIFRVIDPQLMRDPMFLILAFNFFNVGLGLFPTILYLVARAVSYGLPDPQPTTLLTVLGVCSVVGRATHGFVIDRKIITPAQGLGGGQIIAGLVNVFSFPVTNFIGMLLLYGLWGLANGVFHPLTTVVARQFVGAEKLPPAIGFCNLCLGLGGLLGPFIGGWIFDSTGDYNNVYFYSGAMLIFAGFLLVLVPCIRKCKGQEDVNANANN